MRRHLKLLTATVVLASVGLVSAPVSANGGSVTGTVSPTTVDPGETVTVTFEATGDTSMCDDAGPEDGEYANRPLVFGLFPSSVELVAEDNFPAAWYNDGTPLPDLGFINVPGILATSPYDGSTNGWQGSFTGEVTLPTDLTPGTYNAVWSCGFEDSEEYDTQVPGLTPEITVTGSPDPGPAPADDGISLTLDFEVGQNIHDGGAGVPVAGSGLQSGADYIVVLRSDPVEIGAGVNDANGAFSASYPVPPDTPGGPHSVTVTSLNTAGQEVSAVAYFTLDDNGTVTAISYDGPTPPAAMPPAACRPSPADPQPHVHPPARAGTIGHASVPHPPGCGIAAPGSAALDPHGAPLALAAAQQHELPRQQVRGVEWTLAIEADPVDAHRPLPHQAAGLALGGSEATVHEEVHDIDATRERPRGDGCRGDIGRGVGELASIEARHLTAEQRCRGLLGAFGGGRPVQARGQLGGNGPGSDPGGGVAGVRLLERLDLLVGTQ